MVKKKVAKKIDGLTFEQAFKELEEMVAKLEEGELSLEASLELYERGQQLTAYCSRLLEEATLKVTQMGKDG
jgi:exodeoxyribonuclease VII small subunit